MNSITDQEQPKPGKGVEIIVNSRKKLVDTEYVSFQEVIDLAFDDPPSGPDIEFTVKYRNGPRDSKGSLVAGGEPTKIADGMIFDVKYTDKS